ncbi:LAETG motif-containing sortase-dependent surface protein [Streptomyces sp. NBC_01465]|uniref:LAETG motif-containing sortase-dependent surface protein n=1 Tax=Streptomyces sp. NBC_01465 TaxID=2903878 RepID=UPI002E2FD788|nr:LAETG motif-containing sortase-dependent surface protein [Streptomyces sp. NBC_01465]
MTVTRGSWRRRGALIAAATAGVVGVGLSATPAQAHNPNWTVTCDSVSVDLTAYGDGDNTVRVTVDGKDLLPLKHFQNDFNWSEKLGAHDKPLALQLIIDAHDNGYDKTLDKTAPVCEKPSSPPPSTPPASATPTPSATPSTEAPAPSTSASVVPTSAAPAPSKSSDNLAETGSSSSTPLIAGTAAVVLVAGGGIVWATRKRRSAQH